MAYTPPVASAVEFTWVGAPAYTPQAGNAVAVAFPPDGAVADIAAVVAVVTTQTLAHGIELVSVASVPVTAAMEMDYTNIAIDSDVVASVPVAATFDADHGVATDGIASVPVTADLSAAHGVSVAAVATVPVTALQNAVHGVALDGIAAIGLSAAATIVVERYELRGVLRLSGILVNRRVRAYLRSTGALLGEADTVIGKFKVHTGFAPVECYITPIDLSEDATDWLPPTANRITSVLAMDTA